MSLSWEPGGFELADGVELPSPDAGALDGAPLAEDGEPAAPDEGAPLPDLRPSTDLSGPLCTDKLQNGTETDVDCGGTCPKCGVGKNCGSGADCSTGICKSGSCAHPASCAELKGVQPQLGDGVYKILSGGALISAYCDMEIPAELCTTVQGDHTGRTRDASTLSYRMTSVLSSDLKTCSLWNLRAAVDGNPLSRLVATSGLTLSTCRALGLGDDVELGACAFGSAESKCGYTVNEHYRYGNSCSGCKLNDGVKTRYVLQGPMTSARTLSDAAGTIRTRCAVP